jgi:NAD dependent epimerase/dehydratase family enzyme
MDNRQYVLVTGATGFIGAHVVDTLLNRGMKVRGATRSPAKADAMVRARPQHAGNLNFVRIADFESPGGLLEAVRGVDAVIHVASVRMDPTSDSPSTHLLLLDSRSLTIRRTTRKNLLFQPLTESVPSSKLPRRILRSSASSSLPRSLPFWMWLVRDHRISHTPAQTGIP